MVIRIERRFEEKDWENADPILTVFKQLVRFRSRPLMFIVASNKCLKMGPWEGGGIIQPLYIILVNLFLLF